MANNPLGLGRGLDSLIRDTGSSKGETTAHKLPIKDIEPNPDQPRKQFDPEALNELAASIKSQGLLQPILVRPLGGNKKGKYGIVAGERRWRAAQLAGLTEVPVLVRTLSPRETLLAALIENLQREDLNPVEEALGIQALRDDFGLNQEELAQQLGKSRSAVANALRLLSLSEAVQEDLSAGRLSAGHARALLSVTDDKARENLRAMILEEGLSVREAEGMAARWKETGSFRAGASGKKAPKAAAKSRPQSARLLEVQTRLGEALNLQVKNVKVTGKENKGRISLSYNSKAELEALLARLGLAAAGPALSGADRAELPDSGRPALEGADHEALTGNTRAALPAGAEKRGVGGAGE